MPSPYRSVAYQPIKISMTIGTLRERSLHAELKLKMAQPGDFFEVLIDGYIIDIARGDLLIEIQTQNFSAMKSKLAALVQTHDVRLVHPIAAQKWIKRISKDGEILGRRSSPRHGEFAHIFLELVSFPHLMVSPRFSLQILLVEEEEVQQEDNRGSWRRKKRSIVDRKLLDIRESRLFESPRDFRSFLPEGLGQTFTTRDIAEALHQPPYLAQKMAYCLRRMGVIEMTGKKGNAICYEMKQAA